MKPSLILLSFLFAVKVFAHGEQRPGPHNGFITMPGTFHVELVPQMEGDFNVYLMDVNNQNPVTKNSTVDFKLKNAKNSFSFKCSPMDDHFMCSNKDKKVTASKESQIVIVATRNGIKGSSEAVYKMPLVFPDSLVNPNPQSESSNHNAH